MDKYIKARIGYIAISKTTIYALYFPDIKITPDKKLHSTDSPACIWNNKEQSYWLHGVRFDKSLWQKVCSGKMTLKQTMAIGNIEQRMVALKMMDSDKLLKGADAKLIDKSERGNELYLIEKLFSQPAYFLRYTCPSTGRVYVSGIDPAFAKGKTADECMGWKLRLVLEEYNQLKIES